MNKLIKISEDHYVVVDDSIDIRENYVTLKHGIIREVSYLGLDNGDVITHSTKPLERDYSQATYGVQYVEVFDKIQPLNLTEVEELVNGYSVKKMVKDAYLKHSVNDNKLSLGEQIQRSGGFIVGYNEGFKAHHELTKDKLFTEKDVLKAILQAISVNNTKTPIEIIKSIQPKSEWLVDFDENGKLKLV